MFCWTRVVSCDKGKKKKNLLLSLSAFLVFDAFSQSSDVSAVLTLGGITGKLGTDQWLRGKKASGAHTKLKPH